MSHTTKSIYRDINFISQVTMPNTIKMSHGNDFLIGEAGVIELEHLQNLLTGAEISMAGDHLPPPRA
jgi:hypothetical protein